MKSAGEEEVSLINQGNPDNFSGPMDTLNASATDEKKNSQDIQENPKDSKHSVDEFDNIRANATEEE
mgnify:CR=1 FL=1